MPGVDQQPRVDELARPEPVRLLGKFALSWIVPVVWRISLLTRPSLPWSSRVVVVLAVGEDRERALVFCCCCWICGRSVSGKREDQRDRLDLRDDDEAVRGRWADDVADVDLTNAGDAVDRRRQARVAELHLGGVDQRLVGLDRRLQLRRLAPSGSRPAAASPSPCSPKCGVALEIGLGIGELRLIAFAGCRSLVDLRLIGARIDLREQVAGMHGLAFGEVDADDLSLDLGCARRSVL